MKDWIAVTLTVVLCVAWLLIGISGWQLTEKRLGEKIVRDEDKILPPDSKPYFTIIEASALCSTPDL